ncbi:MAG: cell division protein SepF [Defluviitaleaceae bacterium]|nr:cell division protein SepF [Defluviitaleaceae bacterium]
MKELWLKVKSGLRNAMLSPGFDTYDPDNQDEAYYNEEEAPQPEKTWQEHARAATAPKPHKGKFEDKIVELYGRKSHSDNKIQIILTNPKDVNSTCTVTDNIREGKTCAVNLTGVDRVQAQRIADVLAGAVYALDGSISRISKDIFLVAPEGVHISGEMKEELTSGGYLFPWVSAR